MRWPRNRNILVLTAIVLLIAAVAVVGMTMGASRTVSDEPLPGADVPAGSAPADDAALYLLVTAGATTYEPIFLGGEGTLTLTQGEDMVNVIHATPDSIWMESSTCDNQDCVEQGMVTAENRKTRVLGNMIICLPHRVQLELFTADELRAMGFSIADSD